MRIAHFVQRYPPALGGAEAYFARLSETLATAGDQVTVFTSAAFDLTAFWSERGQCLPEGTTWQNGVEVRRYPLWRCPGRRYFLKALSLVPLRPWQCLMLPCNPLSWRMWADAGRREPRFDLVHATAFPYAAPVLCGLRLARRLGVPFLLTPFLHTGDPDNPHDPTRRAYTRRALLWLVNQADRVFVQTQSERRLLLDHGVGGEKLVLQGMGVAARECTGGRRAEARRQWAAADRVVVGHLGNNSEEKGTVDLLRAAGRLWNRGKRFLVVLAGPEMPNFRRFWHDFPHKEHIRRLGVLDDKAKADFYAGLDLFALPSRSDSFGLVLLEAWANGLPNVAYRAGGVADVVRHERDGLLARCGDWTGLGDQLCRLIDQSNLRHQLGQAGKKRVAQEFRWEDKLGLVRRVYQEMAGRPIRQSRFNRAPTLLPSPPYSGGRGLLLPSPPYSGERGGEPMLARGARQNHAAIFSSRQANPSTKSMGTSILRCAEPPARSPLREARRAASSGYTWRRSGRGRGCTARPSASSGGCRTTGPGRTCWCGRRR